jgi:hypothetical protein
MSMAIVFKVFKDSSLITPQGELKIGRIFPTKKAARKARYYYHCTESGTDIYINRSHAGKKRFAVIGG